MKSFIARRILTATPSPTTTTTTLRCRSFVAAGVPSSSPKWPQDRHDLMTAIGTDETVRNHMSYSLAFAALDEGNSFPPLTRPLEPREREQLRISRNQLLSCSMPMQQEDYEDDDNNSRSSGRTTSSSPVSTVMASMDDYDEPLPRTLRDALRPSSRAIVVTEKTMPFKVFDVNQAWSNLCGYSALESKGKSLGSLLKGPQTDQLAVTAMIHQLLHGEDATTILTNYKKDGRAFRNRLYVGPLWSEDVDEPEVTHFVGILKQVA